MPTLSEGRVVRRLGAALCLTAVVLTSPGTASTSAAEPRGPIVSGTDASGDVVVNADYDLLTPAQAQSIDLHSVDVLGRRKRIRFDVALDSILPKNEIQVQRAQQIVIISMTPADKVATWRSQVVLSPQRPTGGTATFTPDLGPGAGNEGSDGDAGAGAEKSCAGLAVTTSKAVVTIKVPKRCLPTEVTRIKVRSSTGTSAGINAPSYSKDHLATLGPSLLK